MIETKPIERDKSALIRRWSIAALLFAATLCVSVEGATAELDPFPLKPPDTSSPRETLQSFLVNINIAIQRYGKKADYATRSKWEAAVSKPLHKAIRCLDLSDTGTAFREITGVETVLFLKEIFDRIEIPPYKEVPGYKEFPGSKAMEKVEERAEKDAKKVAKEDTTVEDAVEIPRWRVPNTEITIARIEKGARQGEYLFTKETVARAKEFYETAKSLSYKPNAAFGIYETYIHAPGSWLDPNWIDALPYWTELVYRDAPIWKWIGSVLSILLGVSVVVLLNRWGKRWDEKHKARGFYWRIGQLVVIAGAIALTLFIEYFIQEQIRIKGGGGDWLKIASSVVITVVVGWATVVFLGRLAQSIIAARHYTDPSIDAHLVRVCTRLVTFVVIVYLVMEAAEILGIPLTPVLAGLGVGGLAVALAARPTLENFISGIILFVDKPVRVGDFCRYGDKTGTVEEIGLRSTRIRTAERTVVTVPNADFSQMEIENFAHRDKILFRTKMELRRTTTEDQLRYVIAEVRELLVADDRVNDDPCRIRMTGYGQYSVDLEIFAYIQTADYNDFLAIREELLLKISGIVQKAGTAYSIPVQIHIPPDTGLNAD